MPSDNRERNFENALAAHLRTDANPRSECADAETLAAYYQASLPAQQIASLKSHITTCERCQQILTTLEATEEIPAPALTDVSLAPAAAAKSPIHILPHRKPVFWQWIAPAGALAAALLVWVAVHENNSSIIPAKAPALEATHQVSQYTSPAQTTASLPPAARTTPSPSLDSTSHNQPSPNSPAALRANPSSKIPSVPLAAPGILPKQKDAFDSAKKSDAPAELGRLADNPMHREDALSPSNVTAPEFNAANQIITVQPEMKEKVSKARRDAGLAGAPKPTPESSAARPAPAPPPRASTSDELPNQSAAVSGGIAQQQEIRGTSRFKDTPELRLANSIAEVTISAPNGHVSWRAGQAGIIEFSPDAGKSWTLQPSGVVNDLLAGSAPSERVCWIVGRGGTILRTADAGDHWQKLRPPAQEDLRSIFAVDMRQATVATANAKFQTTDGGITWKKLPPE